MSSSGAWPGVLVPLTGGEPLTGQVALTGGEPLTGRVALTGAEPLTGGATPARVKWINP